MEALKLVVFIVFLALTITSVSVGAGNSISAVDRGVGITRPDRPDSSLLEQLKSKIRALESRVEVKTKEIEDRNKMIAAKEKIIREKSDRIMSLKIEIASLQEKGKSNAAEQVGKTHGRDHGLEKQVEKLREDIDVKIKETELLATRVAEVEKKPSEINSNFESLQKVLDDQNTKLHRTERALHFAEEEIMKAKLEATSKGKELMEVHCAWLPPWLAGHFNNYQSLLEVKWKVHGKPGLERFMQKAIDKKAQAEKWAAMHVETVKIMLTTKTIEFYQVSKVAVTPHIIKVQELTDSYLQGLRESSKQCIDQVVAAAKPHFNKLHNALEPCTQKVVHAYGKFLESATTYHHQAAMAILLAFVIAFLLKVWSAIFGKKEKKAIRNSNSNNPHGKGKRVPPDNSSQ